MEGLREGAFRMLDATCPAIHSAVQAAAKGLPFMPMRGLTTQSGAAQELAS